MACDTVLAVKILELLFCLACMIYMRVTDYESRQVFFFLEKVNQEWPLLNSVTWEENGAIFTHIVFGSYIIITLGLLIGYLCGELNNGRKMEKYFLGMGALLFIIVGSLIFASLDSVPHYLIKNAAALGTIALLTGLLFILDMGLSRPKPPRVERLYKATQTEMPAHSVDLLDKVHRVPNGDSVMGELRSSLKTKRRTDDDLRYPSEGGSVPDLTIHENGRVPSVRSRGTPEEPTTPDGHRQNGHFHPDLEHDPGRHSRRLATPESSIQHDPRFPRDLELHPKRILQDQQRRLSDEYVVTDRGRERRSTSDREHVSPESYRFPAQRTSLEDSRSPSELDPQHKRSSREQVESRHATDPGQAPRSSVRDERPPDNRHLQRHLTSDQENRNSNSSSGDQRYLEQSEISQRPESITPEQRYRSRPSSIYHGSDSEVDDLMRVPTVSFLLTERGEQVEAQPGGGKRSIRLKPQGAKTGSTREMKLLPMAPIASTSKDLRGSLKSRSAETISDEAKRKQSTRDEAGSPASVGDEREKERYLFGGRPKLSSNRSLDVEAGRLTRFEGISHSPSPDVAHWRYDSRDANFIRTERELPSSPSDPGFVKHTAHNWPDSAPRTPSQSPAGSLASRPQNWPDSRPRTPSQSPQNWPESTSQTPSPGHQVHWPDTRQSSDEGDYATAMPSQSKPPVPQHRQEETSRKTQKGKERVEEEDDEDVDMPSGGSLTTQLLQKWLKQRKSKIGKTK
ncbi:hypothetical protein C0J52_00176 [Blattella germanica]|nr:hypothetical protein C0J52_00176 [Blattella germanica]